MKLYGYTNSDSRALEQLKEVSVFASVQELRDLAKFFNELALSFDAGDKKEHAHFSDFIGDKTMENEFIVCNPFLQSQPIKPVRK